MHLIRTIATAATVLTISATFVSAEPLKEATTTETINIRMDEPTRTFEFATGVKDIRLAPEGIVEVMPQTDQMVSITPIGAGTVLMSAFAPDGKLVQRINIHVPGHTVKIYGQRTVDDGPAPDYHSYLCSDTGCGRADKDIGQPASSSVTVTRQRANGDVVSRTRNY